MIGLQAISCYIPEGWDDNREKLEVFGIDHDFLINKIGVIKKPRKSATEETSDMCVKAYKALAKKIPVEQEAIDCIVVCSQNPDGHGLPHVSAIVHGKLGLKDRVAAFDISLGCSGYVYALSVITSFMKENSLRMGLLFTADPYSKIINNDDKNTSLLFGDAATATLLSEDPVYCIERSSFCTRGKDYRSLICENGTLQMNGRAIFNFSATCVPPQVKDLLNASGYTLEDIDIFIMHQGSKYILDTLSKRLKLDPQKVPSNLLNTGNTVSSSIPLILQNYMNDTQTRKIVISGFGVGLSWATSILNRI